MSSLTVSARPRTTVQTLPAVLLLAAGPLLAAPLLAQSEETVEITDKPVVVLRNTREPLYTWSFHGSRAFLGVQTVETTAELLEHFDVAAESGVLVARITPDSPAASAGLEIGDVIAAVDSKTIESPSELAAAIGEREVGDTVTLEVWRAGEVRSIEATLTEKAAQRVDIRQFHWPKDLEDLSRLEDFDLQEAIELDPETLVRAMDRLNEAMNSPEWQERVNRVHEHQGDLIQRLETLEQKLKLLEQELESLEPED